ncbi:fumarylacetoacetate hydrolase family protein [Acetobacteraceae bacterium H6797]|nr:fumarylacetoacetate hydrolase family protein [Acetobacteraceae bacterium H6797]
MAYVISAPPQPTVPVEGEAGSFPVSRIWCVGRNFADHAREMGHDPDREPPFFFSKPNTAVVPGGGTIPFPVQTQDFHHEIELVVAIGKGGKNIPVEQALEHVYGYAVGLDMTRRDIQAVAKKMGRPWELSKGFDQSCPISAIKKVSEVGHPTKGLIQVTVNGKVQQTGDLNQMIWSVPESIAYLSTYVELLPGDLIMTGTPAGVSAVKPGDALHGTCEGVGEIKVTYSA